MKKAIVAKQKTRGRPATGQTPMMGFRATDEMRGKIVRWAEFQPDAPKLSEAVRRLVEIGLSAKSKHASQRSGKTAAKAKDIAAKTIDHLADKSAPADEQDRRKRRLLKGPEEFREVRVDRGKQK